MAGGFIELSAPPLRDGRDADPRRRASPGAPPPHGGTARMVAVPLMLSAAGHAKGDIPAALARERTRHPGAAA